MYKIFASRAPGDRSGEKVTFSKSTSYAAEVETKEWAWCNLPEFVDCSEPQICFAQRLGWEVLLWATIVWSTVSRV